MVYLSVIVGCNFSLVTGCLNFPVVKAEPRGERLQAANLNPAFECNDSRHQYASPLA
jgi:hypothetical protein